MLARPVPACGGNALHREHAQDPAYRHQLGSAQQRAAPGSGATVDARHVLGFEVKAPQSLWQPDHALTLEEAKKILEKALWDSYPQLAGGPGLLAVAAFNLSAETFEVLTAAGNLVLANPRQPRPLLFGITLHNLGSIAGIDTPGHASIWFAERSRLGRSRFTQGLSISWATGQVNGIWPLGRTMDADEFHKLLGKATAQAQTFDMSVHTVRGVPGPEQGACLTPRVICR